MAFVRDLGLFPCAVLVGTIAGISSQLFFQHLAGQPRAAQMSLAIATTCTGAAHGHLVHRKPIRSLLPNIAAGAPVAYAAMRAIHFLAGL